MLHCAKLHILAFLSVKKRTVLFNCHMNHPHILRLTTVKTTNGVAMRTCGVRVSWSMLRRLVVEKGFGLDQSLDQRVALDVTAWGCYESFEELAKPVRVMHLALVSLSIQDDLIMGPMRCLSPLNPMTVAGLVTNCPARLCHVLTMLPFTPPRIYLSAQVQRRAK
jgi:hypothetical protein